MTDKPQRLAFTIQDLIDRGLGGRTFLYGEIAAGRLRAVKSGRKTLVLADDLSDYMSSLPPVGTKAA